MTTIQLKNYEVIGLMVAAIVLLFIIFRGCNSTDPSIAESKRQVDSVIAAKKVSEAASSKVIDSIFKENNRRAENEKLFSKQLSAKDQQIAIKTVSVTALAKEVQLYEKYKDTTEQLHAAPLLADQVIELVDQVDSFKSETHALRNSLDSSVGATSLILAKKDYSYTELQGQFDFLSGKYSKLDYNYNSLNKKLKRERTLSLILGIAVLVAGGAYLIK